MKALSVALFATIAAACSAQAQITIAETGFELTPGEWTYTVLPSTTNTSGRIHDDVNSGTNGVNADTGSRMWLIRNVSANNTIPERMVRHSLVFDSLDVSGMEDVTVTFRYQYTALIANTYIGYNFQYTTDGSDVQMTLNTDKTLGTGDVGILIPSGGNHSSNGWQTVTINVDPSATDIRFALWGYSRGQETIAFDTVSVTAVPEPSSVALCMGGAILGGVLLRRSQRRKQLS